LRSNPLFTSLRAGMICNQTVENDGGLIRVMKKCVFSQKKSWQCSSRKNNVKYLLASLVSKDGKTEIGDTLVKRAIPA